MIRAMLVALTLLVGASANAQTLDPNRPLRLVVPFAPGGISTALARMVAEGITHNTGRQVIVENRSGGYIAVGGDFVIKQPADGHTMLLVANGFATIHHYNPEMPFDAHREFTPVSMFVAPPAGMLVANNLQVTDATDFLRRARENPNQFSLGATGGGGLAVMASELMTRGMGSQFLVVSYRSQSQALVDVHGGRLNMMFDLLPGVLSASRNGQGRLLMVTSRDRHPAAPDVPSWGELGIEGEFLAWQTLFVRTDTPRPIREELNALIRQSLRTEMVRARMRELGFSDRDVLDSSDLDDSERRVASDIERWRRHFGR